MPAPGWSSSCRGSTPQPRARQWTASMPCARPMPSGSGTPPAASTPSRRRFRRRAGRDRGRRGAAGCAACGRAPGATLAALCCADTCSPGGAGAAPAPRGLRDEVQLRRAGAGSVLPFASGMPYRGDAKTFYARLSNGILWPLAHDRLDRPGEVVPTVVVFSDRTQFDAFSARRDRRCAGCAPPARCPCPPGPRPRPRAPRRAIG